MSASPTPTSLDGFHETPEAQRTDELVRKFVDAVNVDDPNRIDEAVARSALSYDIHGTRSRTGLKRYYDALRQSFSDLLFEVHENIGVLVEGELAALRTIVTGAHSGDYAGVPATGKRIQTSASHVFRVRDGQIVEHWQVMDTYRILAAINAIAGVAGVFQREILHVAESPGGIFQERLGTEFSLSTSRVDARSVVRSLYDGVITTGSDDDADMVADDYIQNSGWTPDGRAAFSSALAISRGAMPDGRALQTHMVVENNRVASRSIWDGTLAGSDQTADFTTLDFFRIEDGLIEEHWESVDWIRAYQSFGLLTKELQDD